MGGITSRWAGNGFTISTTFLVPLMVIGYFSFNGQYSSDALLDFMLGLPSSLNEAAAQRMNIRQDMLGVYAMDDLRLSKHVNLQLGLRWEPFLPEREIFNRVDWFDRAAFNAGTQSTQFTNAPPGLFFPGDAGYPSGGAFARRQLGLFQPRAGFVWDISGNGRQAVPSAIAFSTTSPGLPTQKIQITPLRGDTISPSSPRRQEV